MSVSEDSTLGSLPPGTILPSNQFFVDYSSNSCLKDYESGSFVCMIVPPPVALFDNMDKPIVLSACGGWTTATTHHVGPGIPPVVGLSMLEIRNAVSFVTLGIISHIGSPSQHI